MRHEYIELCFKLSFGVMLAGLILMIFWAKKIYKPLAAAADKDKVISTRAVSFRSFIYMLPGILVFFASAVPAFYFNNLLRRFEYCIQIIKVNPGMAKDSDLLRERGRGLDIDELFERAGSGEK
jgi:hypothetical protein